MDLIPTSSEAEISLPIRPLICPPNWVPKALSAVLGNLNITTKPAIMDMIWMD